MPSRQGTRIDYPHRWMRALGLAGQIESTPEPLFRFRALAGGIHISSLGHVFPQGPGISITCRLKLATTYQRQSSGSAIRSSSGELAAGASEHPRQRKSKAREPNTGVIIAL